MCPACLGKVSLAPVTRPRFINCDRDVVVVVVPAQAAIITGCERRGRKETARGTTRKLRNGDEGRTEGGKNQRHWVGDEKVPQ